MGNKTCIICGGGYSVKEGISKGLWDRIKGQDVWSLNFTYKVMPYMPTREIFVDASFFNNNVKSLQDMTIMGVKIVARFKSKYQFIDEIIKYEATRNKKQYYGKEAINKKCLYYGRMGLCGIFALSLAIAEGYDKIYLLGYDFGTTSLNNVNTHFYQKDIMVISSGVGAPEVYRKSDNTVKEEVEDFQVFTQEKDIEIINVSPNSNIPYFPKITYEEFFTKLENK